MSIETKVTGDPGGSGYYLTMEPRSGRMVYYGPIKKEMAALAFNLYGAGRGMREPWRYALMGYGYYGSDELVDLQVNKDSYGYSSVRLSHVRNLPYQSSFTGEARITYPQVLRILEIMDENGWLDAVPASDARPDTRDRLVCAYLDMRRDWPRRGR